MNEYYVYIYLDPRKSGNFCYDGICFNYEPFYVGKGKKTRLNRHLNTNNNSNKFKNNKINKIFSLGLEPIILKYMENLSEDIALSLEIELIKKIGRLKRITGPLTNVTKGGQRYSGYRHKKEYKEKLYKPVVKYDLNGNFIEEYSSVKHAGEKNNITQQAISAVCNGSIKIFKDKFIFLYKEDKFKNRTRNHKGYKVVRIDYNLNEKIYQTASDAAVDLKTTTTRIVEVCNGNRFQTNGYIFRFIDHPDRERINPKISENYSKYLELMNSNLKYKDLIYKNILHIIYDNKKSKINNIYNLLKSGKITHYVNES